MQATDVPRKGNVDRNVEMPETRLMDIATFPARGTWIEIAKKSSR